MAWKSQYGNELELTASRFRDQRRTATIWSTTGRSNIASETSYLCNRCKTSEIHTTAYWLYCLLVYKCARVCSIRTYVSSIAFVKCIQSLHLRIPPRVLHFGAIHLWMYLVFHIPQCWWSHHWSHSLVIIILSDLIVIILSFSRMLVSHLFQYFLFIVLLFALYRETTLGWHIYWNTQLCVVHESILFGTPSLRWWTVHWLPSWMLIQVILFYGDGGHLHALYSVSKREIRPPWTWFTH